MSGSGSELATGYVSITASAEGVGKAIVAQFQQAQQGATKAGEKSGKGFSAAFGKLAGLATGAALSGMIKGAADAEAGTRKLQAQLALTADETKRFGSDAKALFANNFAGSIDEANDAIKSVVQNIGGMRTSTSADLQSVTGKVSELAQTFGVDLNDVTVAVGQQMKTGLAKNATDALDNIAVGFQQGDDKAGDFLDTLNEYGVQFSKLGIDGTTATGLLSQGLQGGARDADLVADALKEFSIRAVDGSTTTAAGFKAIGLSAQDMAEAVGKGGTSAFTATEQVLTGLKAIKDPAVQAQTAVELFGTQSEDLGKALYSLDLDTAAKGLGTVAGAAQNISDTMGGGANAAITTFWQTLQTTGLTIGQELLPQLTPALGLLQDVGSTAAGAVKFFAGLPGPIKDAGVAFGVMLALRGPLTGFFGQIQARAATAAAALAASNGIAGAAGVAAGSLSRVAGVLGGPWGLAIGAGVTALVSWASKSDDATTKTRDFSSAIDAQTGKLTANAAVDIATQVKDSIDAYKAAGGAAGDYTAAVEGNTVAQQKVLATFTATEKKAVSGTVGFTKYGEAFAALGITAGDVANAYVSGDDAVAALQAKFRAGTDVLNRYGIGMQDVNNIFAQTASVTSDSRTQLDQYHKDVDDLAQAQADAATIANDAAQAQAKNTTAVIDSGNALAGAKQQQDRYVDSLATAGEAQTIVAGKAAAAAYAHSGLADAQDDAKSSAVALTHEVENSATGYYSMTEATEANRVAQHDWQGLMGQTKNIMDQSTQSLETFSFAVDELSGRDRTSEEATKNLNDQVRAIAAAFKDGTDATKGHIESLITASGAIDTTSEAGSKLYDSLNNFRTAADQSTDAAYTNAVATGHQKDALKDAQTAADTARQRFLDQAAALGINAGAAEKMADKLGILEGKRLTDKDFDIKATDHASAPIAGVQKDIDGLHGKTVPLTVAVGTALSSVGSVITSALGGIFQKKAKGGIIRGPGTGTSDSILIAASNNEGVNTAAAMSHPENVAAMHFMNAGGVIPGFARGGLISLDLNSTGNAAGAVGQVADILSRAVSAVGAANAKAAAAAKAAQVAAIPQASSAGVEQWRALALKVAAAHGENPASVQVMLNQMARESSGNPAAINLTDSNAIAGHPSVGLLQFIPSTFRAHADPGFNTDIYDPESQMRAWYNYINAQYGGYTKFAQRGYGAYAKGDLIKGVGSGTSDSNLIRVSNGEGINTERAMSHAENVAAMRFMNAGGIIPGFASGGLVSAGTLAGNPAATYTDRLGRVVDAMSGIVDEITDARSKAADLHSAAGDARAAVASAAGDRLSAVSDASSKLGAVRKDTGDIVEAEQKLGAARKTRSHAQIAQAQLELDSATIAHRHNLAAAEAELAAVKKVQDAKVGAAQKDLANAVTAATAAQRNAAAATRAQASLSGSYRLLQTMASRYDSLTGRLSLARDTLAQAKTDKASAVAGYASSFAGFDGGLTGHSDTRTTSKAVVNGLNYDLSKILAFRTDLSKLAKEGLNADYLNELSREFGSGGEITAHALATGPLADIRAANTAKKQIDYASLTAGRVAPSATYDGAIKTDAAAVTALSRAVTDQGKQIQTLANAIDGKVIHALEGWTVQIGGDGIGRLIAPHMAKAAQVIKRAKVQTR